MKHISKTIILVLSAAAVTVSCQEKELSAGIGQEGIGEYRTFRATTADESDEPSTRTYLGGSSADKSRPVYWNKSDAIFVTDGKTGSEFRVVSESGSTDAIIEGEIPSSDRYSAVYPYRIVKSLRSDGSFDVDFPDWQLCSQDGIYSEYYPMLASCEEGVLRFRNVFGIFVLQLTGDDDDVLNITFEGKNKDGEDLILAGEACIGNPSEPVYEWGSDTQKVVTLDCWHSGKEKLSSEPSSFHIVLPPQEYASFTVTVNMVDGRKMTIHSSKPLTIHRSGYTVASPLHFKADAPEAEYPANCYVVKPGGSVIFPAVKGNTTESVGPVSSVSVLWESFGTDIKPAVNDVVQNVTLSGTDSNRKIAVTAGKKEGNAVIAAKDVSGNILWSWHIWVTSADLDALAQVYNNGAGTMMDRNLGATSATPGDVGALGLLYQWGRKDPFLGSPSITSRNRATSTITWPSAVESNSSNGTIAYATSHPTTFITTNKYNGDWYYTGSSSTDDMRWNSNKGVYDPCPSGYRVPTGGNNGVWAKALYYLYDIANGPINWACKGMDFSNYFIPNTLCWYPFSGYIYNGKYSSYVGMYGSYWSCTPLDNNAYYLSITEKYTVSAAETDRREIGMSVRCIKEGSMSPDINVSSVSLNKSSLTLTEGYTETLTATVSPSNATNKNVSWKSSNTSVATVSSSGKVSAIKAGSATITVTTDDGGKTATCSVTVNAAAVDPSKATDLSSSGTANCYIVSAAGDYKFKTVQGNTSTSVGSVSSASVVWETFGTSTAPTVGDLVNAVSYSNGYISFRATGKEGNALIAAKDAKGNILWSWHIWCTDKPEDQVYKNNAGTMMDRNLGATSATPGDVGALGLLYQWGRKDPFLSGSSISSNTQAKSTITWPSPVSSNSSNGTIAYATSHPTTFITTNKYNQDWYYTGSDSTDDTRWNSSKGTYDPCPPGYRVPDGGSNGVWSKALGSSSSFSNDPWNSTNKGMDFKSYFTSSTQCWYPASGFLYDDDGSLGYVGNAGYYRSCTPYDNCAYCLIILYIHYSSVGPSGHDIRAQGLSVRCTRE